MIELALRINDLEEEDFGVYTCVAANALGHAEASVNVYGKFTLCPKIGVKRKENDNKYYNHSIFIYVALNVDNCGMYTFSGSSVECIHSTC